MAEMRFSVVGNLNFRVESFAVLQWNLWVVPQNGPPKPHTLMMPQGIVTPRSECFEVFFTLSFRPPCRNPLFSCSLHCHSGLRAGISFFFMFFAKFHMNMQFVKKLDIGVLKIYAIL